ncbi:MAG: DinB family protein [Candidatus Zixiibacteriota bacterium]
MYRKIDDFMQSWDYEAKGTQKILDALTDQSLSQAVAKDHRTIGRMAWHLVTTIPEMMGHTGLSVGGADPHSLTPADAATIKKSYAAVAKALGDEVRAKWQDAALEVEDNMYGETWKRGVTLTALLMHQAHHRGQLTVLMRQAGLRVPGVYGPALEEWSQYGQPAPPV